MMSEVILSVYISRFLLSPSLFARYHIFVCAWIKRPISVLNFAGSHGMTGLGHKKQLTYLLLVTLAFAS